MTFKKLLEHLEQEVKKREELLETANNPSNFKNLHRHFIAKQLAENALAEAKHRLTLIQDFLHEAKVDTDSDTEGLEQFLFLGRRE